MRDGVLTEAYQRFHRTGPEWGADQLTNHGPMAVEVLVRRGRAEVVPRWVDAYIRRLDELPRATGEITDASWPEALDAVPRIASQQGNLADRFGQLTQESGWPASVGRLRPAATPGQVPDRLADLTAAATLRYLSHGHGHPVLLVHTATAPNAVLHALPALPDDLWEPSLTAVWTASAAIFAAYAPPQPAPPQPAPPEAAAPGPLPAGPDAAAEAIDRAVAHGDEHVIKFTDTAAEVYARTGQADALAAALRTGTLIPSPRD